MRPLKVYVVGNDIAIERIWTWNKHEIVNELSEADVVQFIGGADINPELYGEKQHELTNTNLVSDKRDMDAWNRCQPHQLKIGICRGGQFLNVVNGGAMWQHVDGHRGWKGHLVHDLISSKDILVTSTHHQMMIPAESGEVLAFARNIAKDHKTMKPGGRAVPRVDTEVIWYYKTKSLCFQPHPEINDFKDCRTYYFNLVERLYEPNKKKA